MLGLCSSRQGVFGLSQELSKTSLPTLAGRVFWEAERQSVPMIKLQQALVVLCP